VLRALLVALALLAAVVPGSAACGQGFERAVRFQIESVGDSTFTFEVGGQRWVAPEQRGIAVDPRRRDALIARFVVWRVEEGLATALITGETTRLRPQHVAILRQPPRRWFRNTSFWTGAAAGLVAGVLGAIALR
jgi:hypothetical protein